MTDIEHLISCVDLTDLSDDCTPAAVEALCEKAAGARTAAVCVWPRFVPLAVESLHGARVRVATVVNFPGGDGDPFDVLAETAAAIGAGAEEIDVVIPYRRLQAGEPGPVTRLLEGLVQMTSPTEAVVKAILETGELGSAAPLVRIAANLASDAGVDFLKTSTGKTPHGADPEAVTALLEVAAAAGRPLGVKVSGGVRTAEAALGYLQAARSVLGADQVGPERFRIGASALLDELLAPRSR